MHTPTRTPRDYARGRPSESSKMGKLAYGLPAAASRSKSASSISAPSLPASRTSRQRWSNASRNAPVSAEKSRLMNCPSRCSSSRSSTHAPPFASPTSVCPLYARNFPFVSTPIDEFGKELPWQYSIHLLHTCKSQHEPLARNASAVQCSEVPRERVGHLWHWILREGKA